MIYFDTAYILKCYINEEGSEAVRGSARKESEIACCEYGRVELHAALHRCLRDRIIDEQYLRTVLEQLALDEEDHIWHWLPLTRDLMDSVAEAFRRLPSSVYLRTGDAIHLQCAADNAILSVFTNDVHMLKAASHFGVQAGDVIQGKGS